MKAITVTIERCPYPIKLVGPLRRMWRFDPARSVAINVESDECRVKKLLEQKDELYKDLKQLTAVALGHLEDG